MTNTQRTLKYLKDQDYRCDIAERWIKIPNHPAGGKRRDIFGFIDVIALGKDNIIAVQSCGQAFSEHNRKIMRNENVIKWLESNGKLLLIGWRKIKKKRGSKQMIWSPRVKEYKLEDFNESN